jgi:hypothetical protein
MMLVYNFDWDTRISLRIQQPPLFEGYLVQGYNNLHCLRVTLYRDTATSIVWGLPLLGIQQLALFEGYLVPAFSNLYGLRATLYRDTTTCIVWGLQCTGIQKVELGRTLNFSICGLPKIDEHLPKCLFWITLMPGEITLWQKGPQIAIIRYCLQRICL